MTNARAIALAALLAIWCYALTQATGAKPGPDNGAMVDRVEAR